MGRKAEHQMIYPNHTGQYVPYFMSEVMRRSKKAHFTVATMFCGGGGSSIGHRLAGGRVLLANEFVPEAARTYRANFPDCHVDQRDIREIISSQNSLQEFMSSGGLNVGELDLLDGSPPCCEFSVAGNGLSDEDTLRNYSDVKQKNIASLPFDFIELAQAVRPKVVFCENVPGLTFKSTDRLFRDILDALRFCGGERRYYVSWKIIPASDYGVAQRRHRLIIVGVRVDVATVAGICQDEDVARIFPAPTRTGVTVRSALSSLEHRFSEVEPWIKSIATSSLGTFIRLLPPNPPRPIRLRNLIPEYRKKFTLVRSSWDCPSTTLVVSGQRPDGMTGVIHPAENRKFTIRELKRLFSLPDDYVLTGTLAQASERICRMVPPFLTQAVSASIFQQVLAPFLGHDHGSF